MKIGLFDIMQLDPTRNESIQEMYARRLNDLALADELGFDAAFFAERHFMRNYAIPSAVAWIAAASQRTSRMRLGSLAFTLPIKAPVQLAEDIAVLDQMCGGRLEVGFGLGHRTEELQALGQDPQLRNHLFQRRMAVMRALWTGGGVSLEQDDLVIRSAAIHPLPMQLPHPPLWFAGTDPTAAHWMGSQGFGLAVGFKPSRDLAPTVDAFRAGTIMAQPEAVRPSPLGQVICMKNVYVAESDEAAITEVADDLIRLNEVMSGEQAEASRSDRHRQQRAAAEKMIRDEMMIAGSTETVCLALQDLKVTLGVDIVLANVYAMGVDDQRVHRTMRALSGPIRSALAEA